MSVPPSLAAEKSLKIRRCEKYGLIVLTTSICSTAEAKPIYVDADAAPGGDGTSWVNAYKYLQDALNEPPTSGDEIWVAAGTYKPDQDEGGNVTPGDRMATFQLINGVALYGGFAGGETSLDERDWQTNVTILSGDLLSDDTPGLDPRDLPDEPNRGDNSYHVVTGSGTNETAVLDGFTITAGNANEDSYPNDRGGGMYNYEGSPTVRNCAFVENSARGYAGMAVYGGGGIYNSGNPEITSCLFKNNWARAGGGIYNSGTDANITNCTFVGNGAEYGGGIYGVGTVTNCIL